MQIKNKQWDEFVNSYYSNEKITMEQYFHDAANTDGVKQLNDLNVLSITQIPNMLAFKEWCVKEYPILESASVIYSFIVATECDVKYENAYFHNGINYFLLVLCNENNAMKLVQFNIPSYQLLISVGLDKIIDASSPHEREGTNALNALYMRECGLITNDDFATITNGFTILQSNHDTNFNVFVDGTKDFPNLGLYSNYAYPTYIKVKLKDGSINFVDFVEYMKNGLPNEWIGGWNQDALVAGAMAVKMIGWYRTIKPVSITGGYHVTTTTQNYKPNSAITQTNNAVAIVFDTGMANSQYNLFFPEYAKGNSGTAGTQGGGQMKQYGSQYLAQQEQSLQSTDETHYYVILQPDFVFIDITVQQLPDQAERIVNDMLFHG